MTQGDCVVNKFPPQNTIFSGFPFGCLSKAKIRICFSAEKPAGCNMPPACCQEPPFNSLLLKTMPNKKTTLSGGLFVWRRRRDLNPRYPFGVYTISNRARSASYATSPCGFPFGQPGYNTTLVPLCQELFLQNITLFFSLNSSGFS